MPLYINASRHQIITSKEIRADLDLPLIFVIVINRVIIQFIKIKKLCQSHVECNSKFMERFNSRIFCLSSYDIIKCGLLHIAHCCKLVYCNSSLLAKTADTLYIDFRVIHLKHLTKTITHLWVIIMITVNLMPITRIRVDFCNILPLKYIYP